MKIINAIITPMPRPMPQGMFDPMPEVVATFEDGSTKRLFSFFPDDCTRVRIQAVVPGLFFQPVEWIEADHLLLLPTNNK